MAVTDAGAAGSTSDQTDLPSEPGSDSPIALVAVTEMRTALFGPFPGVGMSHPLVTAHWVVPTTSPVSARTALTV